MERGGLTAGPVAAAFSLAALMAAPLAAGQGAPGRAELEDLRKRLEAAASRAAGGGFLAGPGAGRAYRLEGYGALLVLSPRVLPRRVVSRTMVAPPGDVADALAAARRGLEERLDEATAPGVRRELRRNIEKLRTTEAELRRLSPSRPPHPPALVTVPIDDPGPPLVDLSGLEREMDAQMAAYAAALRGLEAFPGGWPLEDEREIRRHLRLVEEHAEAFRLQAERARRQVEREVRTRLAPPAAPPPAAPPELPAAPDADEVSPEDPAGVLPAPTAPSPPEEPPSVAAAPEWPAAPARWRFWFDLPGEPRVTLGETADPAPVVAAVREALAASLASHPRPLASLRPDDVLAVAVDFVSDGLMRAPPVRTLVARVRARDLEERRRGRISAAELQARIEFDEE